MTRCPPEIAAQLNVSRETLDRLEAFVAVLLRWNEKINLVSPGTIKDVWRRHILDSAQLYSLVDASQKNWADLGSGGGFPGLVVALLAKESDDLTMTLVESDRRKAAFLRAALRECDASARIVTERIEALPGLSADILSARALAPLDRLLAHCETHLAIGGTALFPKGARVDEEVAEARKKWSFECEFIPSVTDQEGVILKIGDVQRA